MCRKVNIAQKSCSDGLRRPEDSLGLVFSVCSTPTVIMEDGNPRRKVFLIFYPCRAIAVLSLDKV
jgi:hypothetical protein